MSPCSVCPFAGLFGPSREPETGIVSIKTWCVAWSPAVGEFDPAIENEKSVGIGCIGSACLGLL